MEHVAQVDQGRSRWFVHWPPLVLTLLFVTALCVVAGQPLLWAAGTLLTVPLVLIALPAFLLLPGLALLRLLWPEPLAAALRWPLAIGISCALPPILLLLSAPLGLRWNSWLSWGYLALSAAIWLWPQPKRANHPQLWPLARWQPSSAHALLLVMTAMALLVQLFVVRELPVGMWGDSYHHTMIAQLMVTNGGLFSSWQPYAPLATFTYHYGFHSLVAWLSWLSGTAVAQSLLLVGQVQIALTVPLVYLFTQRLVNNERAALWAALIAGFAGLMPMFYVNWGRYTQLAGQTILLPCLVAWMRLLDLALQRPYPLRQVLRLLILVVLLTAGLALTHYRVGVFAACFVAIYALVLLLAHWRNWPALDGLLGTGLIAGELTLLLILPWLLRLREGALLRIGQHFLQQNIGTEATNTLPLDQLLTLYTPLTLLLLAICGIVLLLAQRQRAGLLLAGWATLVWLAANPYLIGLPGAGIVTNFAVLIASYLVLAPLSGAAVALLVSWLERKLGQPLLLSYLQVGAGTLLLIWSVSWQQQIVNPAFMLFTAADAQAMAWIRAETSPEARFFVNSFPAYSGTLYAGSDGGWWLPFMTNRQSNLPPITYGSEAAQAPDYLRSINALNAAIQQYPLDAPETAAALRAAGFTYLYDGPAANPPGEFINPALLARSPLYEQVYSQAGVTIWRVR